MKNQTSSIAQRFASVDLTLYKLIKLMRLTFDRYASPPLRSLVLPASNPFLLEQSARSYVDI